MGLEWRVVGIRRIGIKPNATKTARDGTFRARQNARARQSDKV